MSLSSDFTLESKRKLNDSHLSGLSEEKKIRILGTFDALPDELLLRIFDYLEPKDMVAVATVSKKISSIAQDPYLVAVKGIYDEKLMKIFREMRIPYNAMQNAWMDDEFCIKHKKALENARSLELAGSEITLDFFKFINDKCSRLVHLSLSLHRVDPPTEMMRSLSTNLTSLDLSNSYSLSDEGIKEISRLEKLTSLNLHWCSGITGEGFKSLKNLRLTSLNLQGCKALTDEGLKEVAHMKSLTCLNLSESGDDITREGLKELAKLTNLTSIKFEPCFFSWI